MHLAIDFGSKLAGTTALCFEKNGYLHWLQSAKKQDADTWLQHHLDALRPAAVFIDAPLSLPGVYTGQGSDYFYRACDRALGAMSPMFLGGLTARSMRLRATLPATPFYEVYPAHLVRMLFPSDVFYKNNLPAFLENLCKKLPLPVAAAPENWHQVDATLAWLSGWRYAKGSALAWGEPAEGVVWV